ncbi:putative lipid II flippase MurJ [Abditibacteriota bacterium]|nr:putative lipid II flippase MurJ [Abditibacteriota bacterium]
MPAIPSNSPVVPSTKPAVRATAPLRAALVLSALYFLARFIGLFQSALITALLPPYAADAYKYAFALPDFLNYLVAGGAMSLTFIPLFTSLWDKGKEAQAWRFYSALASLMGFVLVALTVLLMIFAPQIIAITKPGLATSTKEGTYDAAIAMTRVMLPAQLFFYLGGLFNAVLNTFKRFGASGWTGSVYNAIAMIVAVPMWFASNNPVSFAIGILLGAFVGNFLLPLIALRTGPRAQRPRFSFRIDLQNPSVRRFFRLAIPIMIGVSFPVVDVWVVQFFTSDLPAGEFSRIDNANRLMIAAQGLLGQAAAVAAFPFLSSKVALGEFRTFSEFLRSGLRRLLFVTLPVSVLLILWSQPIVALIFGWGKFNHSVPIAQTAQCFALFSVGLFAWGAQGFVARGFYALGDTRTPTIYGSILTVLYIGLCAVFKKMGFGIAGLALATSIGAAGQFVGLLVLLERRMSTRRYNAPIGVDRIAGTLVRTFVSCLLMGVSGLFALLLARPVVSDNKLSQLLLLIWTGGVALFVFISAANRFEIPEWLWLRDKFARRRARS